ncbi:MAG: hypothetical protein P1U63_00110 [Coxiellaceae bacterium]|nr:hypothetical protein [Coxiellaceae bacterium]
MLVVDDASDDDVVIEVAAEDDLKKKYYAEFKQSVQGTIDHIDSGRSVTDAMMVLAVLVIGGIASYQSFAFAKGFVARILGPNEANAPDLLQNILPSVSGASAYTANASIPVISSDVSLITTLNIFACLLSGIAHCITLGRSKSLTEVRKKHEWHGAFTFGYSLLVLGLSVGGSVANVEAAHDSVKGSPVVWAWSVIVCNAIVQLLQNSRAVKLLLSKDTSHLKLHRLEQQRNLLPQAEREKVTDGQLHAMSMGQHKLLPMWTQVGVLVFGLASAGLYNYASAIKPIVQNNGSWAPQWRYGLAGVNFLVKTVLLTRATTNQTRRILSSQNWNWSKGIGLLGLTLFGMLSIGSASEYPKKYLFGDDSSFTHSLMSMGLAEAACLALNLGDMFDAGKIILGFMFNKVLMQCMLGRRPDPSQRYGATFTDFMKNSMEKTMQQDESHYFHHREYEEGHEHGAHVSSVAAISSKARNFAMTACNLQPAYHEPNMNQGFVEMGGSEYHVKPAGKAGLDSWHRLSELRSTIFSDARDAIAVGTPNRDKLARQASIDTMEDLYQDRMAECRAMSCSR